VKGEGRSTEEVKAKASGGKKEEETAGGEKWKPGEAVGAAEAVEDVGDAVDVAALRRAGILLTLRPWVGCRGC